ncbi:AAA-ATPase ASD, mitochondrial [Vitis vinifera]|uniref:AAA-ATPase ASD, mitochondrial n=1 Tax=Vitis vinifera TaxID=29760 RepID=A0A438JIS6_VITVI|nr:AAA-ATPase ASD, mitochondrial [Vitis vinifera]
MWDPWWAVQCSCGLCFRTTSLSALVTSSGDTIRNWVNFFNPYIEITFDEFTGKWGSTERSLQGHPDLPRLQVHQASLQAQGGLVKNSRSLVLSIDDHEEVVDVFQGVQVWWISGKQNLNRKSISIYPVRGQSDDRRYYTLTFHQRHWDLISGPYLNYVLREGKALKDRNRQKKLYTNKEGEWNWVAFEHPATAWKRGYLLYGPPGTGKSTMIAAMANLLIMTFMIWNLLGWRNNTELKMLLMEISSKSIIVIEDIDCSLDLTGQRKKAATYEDSEEEEKKRAPKPARELLREVDMTPADVAEHLTTKTLMKHAGICLEGLISAIQRKTEARLKKKLSAKGAKSSRKMIGQGRVE